MAFALRIDPIENEGTILTAQDVFGDEHPDDKLALFPTRKAAVAAVRRLGEVHGYFNIDVVDYVSSPTTKAKVIESHDIAQPYNLEGLGAIIDHPKYGRLYIQQGFGGLDDLIGGAVRWEHGIACQLLDSDTLATLNAQANDYVTVLDAMINGYDNSRPVMPWSASLVRNIAKSAGL